METTNTTQQATPHATLIEQVLDPCRAKNEREWAAGREIEQLRAELELERGRLAACGVAAQCNTPESALDNLLEPDSPYVSASYRDVCAAVDREMALRERVAGLEKVRSTAAMLLDNLEKYNPDVVEDAGDALRLRAALAALPARKEGER